MTQLGEPIDVGVFVSDDKTHSEQTCPWHEAAQTVVASAMDPQETDEDSHGAIPANMGKKLGNSLNKANESPPTATSLSIAYRAGSVIAFKMAGKNKRVQTYESVTAELFDYPLQYAPHHLIPGNESLKGSEVLAYMGDDEVIGNYEPPSASKIKKGKTIGYDVNAAYNGVWLPSPYALSNSNKWPSEDGLQVILKRMGQVAVDEAESFKTAYVAAGIEASGHRQFHMRHEDYSYKVQEILDAMANKMLVLSKKCLITGKDPNNGKFDPPGGLKAKLNALSARMKTMLTGGVWRAPFFTDHLSEEYAGSLKRVRRSTRRLRVM